MADPFFDLGLTLPQVDAAGLRAALISDDEIFEKAFTPSAYFQAPAARDTYQFKGKTFKRMRFYETHFVRVVFTKCTFDECLFLGAHFEDCEFHDCRFIRCNTNKFRLTRTYLDPQSFIENIFDKTRYANVGVDLFHTLMKNSVDESQPEFRDLAEFHFRLWQRYNRTSYWKKSSGKQRWFDLKFYSFWLWNVLFQRIFGYGVRVRNILYSTPILFCLVWLFNYLNWDQFGVDSTKLDKISEIGKAAFYTVGTMSTFGTGELNPTTPFGLAATSCEVLIGITWIALSTAMIVKRFVR